MATAHAIEWLREAGERAAERERVADALRAQLFAIVEAQNALAYFEATGRWPDEEERERLRVVRP